MTREDLIKKWLDNELNANELKAFEALDDYDALTKLSESLRYFKAPEYQSSEELPSVLYKIRSQEPKVKWINLFARVAAVFAICFSVYYYTTTLDTTISTLAAVKTETTLPDHSEVSLNALSSIRFNKKDWNEERLITLDGEAYFKVSKGKRFSVETSQGTVTVLGTQFNVKHRDALFEVICYEGSVQVEHGSNSKILSPGDSFLILDGKYIAKEKDNTSGPNWITNESYFKSMPFDHVLREFERQYNLTIASQDVDLNQLFTGSFVHNDKTLALKSITLPLHLKYRLEKDGSIVLTRD